MKKFTEEHKQKLSDAAKQRKYQIRPGMQAKKEHVIVDSIAHKTCYDCKELQNLDSYHGDNKRWDKKSDLCKTCHARKSRERYQRTKTRKIPLIPEEDLVKE